MGDCLKIKDNPLHCHARGYHVKRLILLLFIGVATPNFLPTFTRLRKGASCTRLRCFTCATIAKNFACRSCDSMRRLLSIHTITSLIFTIYSDLVNIFYYIVKFVKETTLKED